MNAHPTATFPEIFALGRKRNLLPRDSGRARYTLKSRGAIYQLLRALTAPHRTEVLLPAYHCPTMVHAVLRAGLTPRYYGVLDDLTPDRSSLTAALGPGTAAVIVVNYFGFPIPLDGIVQSVHAAGALLLEDCSHSFLRANPLRLAGERGDAAVYALWKLLPSGVGGLARINADLADLPAVRAHVPFKSALRLGKRLAEEAVENLPPGIARRSILKLEQWRVGRRRSSGKPSASGSDVSAVELRDRYPIVAEDFECSLPRIQRYMAMNADLEKVARERRANYQTLAESLADVATARPLYPTLPADVVPWCFPVRLKTRGHFDFRMRERGVPLFTFGETLHPTLFESGAVSEAVLSLACSLRDDVLCLAVHQNISRASLLEAAAHVRDVLSESAEMVHL